MLEAQLINGARLQPKNFAGLISGLPFYNHVYYVGSTANGGFPAGSDTTNNGLSVDKPFATLQAAITAITANAGDLIVLLPGHSETISTATASAINKAGIRIVGVGTGSLRPTFTFATVVGATMTISAANVQIDNVRFVVGLDNITAMLTITGADVTFLDCEFVTNTATLGAAIGILTGATADRLRIERCRFLGAATNTGTTTTAQIDHEAGVDYIVKDSYFTGKMTQSITNTATVLRGLIHNNVFVVATGTKAINMAAASTPMISSNRINVPSGTAPIVAAAGFVAGNIYSAAAGVTAGTAATI